MSKIGQIDTLLLDTQLFDIYYKKFTKIISPNNDNYSKEIKLFIKSLIFYFSTYSKNINGKSLLFSYNSSLSNIFFNCSKTYYYVTNILLLYIIKKFKNNNSMKSFNNIYAFMDLFNFIIFLNNTNNKNFITLNHRLFRIHSILENSSHINTAVNLSISQQYYYSRQLLYSSILELFNGLLLNDHFNINNLLPQHFLTINDKTSNSADQDKDKSNYNQCPICLMLPTNPIQINCSCEEKENHHDNKYYCYICFSSNMKSILDQKCGICNQMMNTYNFYY